MVKPPRGTLTQVERDRLRFLKARFDLAHTEYAAALERGDFAAARQAVRQQRDILNEQQALIHFQRLRAASPMTVAVRPSKPPARPAREHVAWTLVKVDCRIDLVLREHRLGTEVRGMHGRRVLWTELVRFGSDHDSAAQRVVADARTAWLSKGWRE